MKRKVVIIGAGHVGSHCARALAAGRICNEIVLVDTDKEKARAQALDVADALSFPSVDITVRDGELCECSDADITVIAIGKPREKGQTRLDLLGDSILMAKKLAADLKEVGVGGVVITITNPVDIISDYIREALGMETNEFNPYRKRLIRKGIVSGETRGYVYFTLPLFDEYVVANY